MLGVGGAFSKENVCLALRQLRGGPRTLPVSVDSQLPSAQNKPPVKVAYFEVTPAGQGRLLW